MVLKTIVYILYSKKLNRFYTGLTTLPLEERVNNHLKKKYDSKNFTQKADDWTIYISFELYNYSQGRKLELFIKKMKSSKFIRSLKDDEKKYESILKKFNNS
jgi:putative endonuclease